jgi:hypothetical protein
VLESFFSGDLGHSRPEGKSNVARAALTAAVRPKHENRQKEQFNQTAPPRPEHYFTSA